MIARDQPTIFGEMVVAGLSAAEDGNMRFGGGDEDETREDRIAFLQDCGIEATQATLVSVNYDSTDFCRYRIVDDEHGGEGMLAPVSSLDADALVVTRPDHALFLPLADCIGAILYDPYNQVLMVSHLGRHSIEQEGATKSVAYLRQNFDSTPDELLVWLSPAAGAENYPLHTRGGRGMHQVVVGELLASGVRFEHIEVSEVDTTESDEYFSHSEYQAGLRDSDGRFAIVAMMRD